MRVGPTIDWLEHPAFAGRIGLTHCPGRRVGSTGAELAQMQESGATAVVSLLQEAELDELGLSDFGDLVGRAGMVWHHLPIVDFGVPDDDFEARWAAVGAELRDRLARAESVVIHCYAGLGRTGMVAARLLVDHGEEPEPAIRKVRAARSGAIQNDDQERWVLGLDPPSRQEEPS